jgi:NAD(P)-dependent dehydrogenase (short-subunit alcohol dehydrogenase family)
MYAGAAAGDARRGGSGALLTCRRAALGKELRSAYSATKAALLGMTRVWALELGQDGITVNAIGPVRSALNSLIVPIPRQLAYSYHHRRRTG